MENTVELPPLIEDYDRLRRYLTNAFVLYNVDLFF